MFRERDIAAGRLTVLVVSQRTDEDMAAWSEQVEAERLELAAQVSRRRHRAGPHTARVGRPTRTVEYQLPLFVHRLKTTLDVFL